MYTIIIIDEENQELVRKEEVDESEVMDQIIEILDDGVIETHEECESICNEVSGMLSEIGIETDNHDEMIEELQKLKLVEKEVEHL